MNSTVSFDFEGSDIRMTTRNGEPWFVASDVCRVLEVGNSRDAVSRLDEDEKGVVSSDTPGGRQNVTVINESGLYSLILTSRKPQAKRFKKWVTSEVLPSIRKTGTYASTGGAGSSDPTGILEELNKVAAFDLLSGADGLYGLQNAARHLEVAPRMFIDWLKQNYLFARGGALIPHAKYRKLFAVKTFRVRNCMRSQTFITPSGIAHFSQVITAARRARGVA